MQLLESSENLPDPLSVFPVLFSILFVGNGLCKLAQVCIILLRFLNLAFKVEKNENFVEKHSAHSFRDFEERGLGPVSRKSW